MYNYRILLERFELYIQLFRNPIHHYKIFICILIKGSTLIIQ